MIKNWPLSCLEYFFMYLQLRLRSQNLKRKRRKKKPNTKQCLKFRDSQGSEISIPNLACSPNPAKVLGISGLEGSLKVTHSKLPPMQEFPLKLPQQVANPHIRLTASREEVCNPFVGQPWLFLVMGPRGEKINNKKNPSATIVQFGKPLACIAWGYFHSAALKSSGMCRVKKKITISWWVFLHVPFQIPIPTLTLACQDST